MSEAVVQKETKKLEQALLEAPAKEPSRGMPGLAGKGYDAQQNMLSNAAQTQQIPPVGGEKTKGPKVGDGNERGLDNYQNRLGKTVGGRVYREARKAVTREKVGKYAHQIVDAGLNYVGDQFKALDKKDGVHIDPAAVNAVAATFSQQVAKGTAQWAKESEVPADIQGWVDDNPVAVTSVMVLGAAAAIAADMKIPELKKKMKLTDDLSAQVGVNLGTFQHIAVERVRGELKWQSGNLKITAGAETNRGGDYKASVGLSYSW